MVGVDQVLEKLSGVIDPDLKKDIVSMGMIKDLEVDGGSLKFTLELTTPACPFNAEIEEDVRKAVGDLGAQVEEAADGVGGAGERACLKPASQEDEGDDDGRHIKVERAGG